MLNYSVASDYATPRTGALQPLSAESESEATQLCLILCDPMDYCLQGSSIHGIFEARVLEYVAISFSRGSSQPRDRTNVSFIAGGFFTTEVPGKNKPLDSKTQLI